MGVEGGSAVKGFDCTPNAIFLCLHAVPEGLRIITKALPVRSDKRVKRIRHIRRTAFEILFVSKHPSRRVGLGINAIHHTKQLVIYGLTSSRAYTYSGNASSMRVAELRLLVGVWLLSSVVCEPRVALRHHPGHLVDDPIHVAAHDLRKLVAAHRKRVDTLRADNVVPRACSGVEDRYKPKHLLLRQVPMITRDSNQALDDLSRGMGLAQAPLQRINVANEHSMVSEKYFEAFQDTFVSVPITRAVFEDRATRRYSSPLTSLLCCTGAPAIADLASSDS
ncbi:hypothetical protein KC356_g92 [Hortaea werneckii]|nr:hypothetical protein KC356_g92 [Hortaea werneckii]